MPVRGKHQLRVRRYLLRRPRSVRIQTGRRRDTGPVATICRPVSSRIATVLLVLAAAAPAQSEPAPPLDQKATEDVVQTFTAARDWAMQAIALLSLGTDWHPSGSAIVLQALQSKDARLRAFGIEQLRRTDQRVFASVCTADIVTDLVEQQLTAKNELMRARALEVCRRLCPGAADAAAVQKWWREHQAGHAPPAWIAPPRNPNPERTVALRLIERAFDLRNAGLQLAIVIDSTLSMQPLIDAARDAIADIAAMLHSISPKLELGLVTFKDTVDWPAGAKILEPMTHDQNRVRIRLASLTAAGGGDYPEKVDAGIEMALSKAMGWDKDANRLILVLGDAPPHKQDLPKLLTTVERAHQHPFQDPKQPQSGDQPQLKPFIVSTIATDVQAKPAFEQIARAGGGTCVMLSLAPTGGPALLPGARPAAKDDGAEQVARHVLLLSFGVAYEPQLRVFVDTFFDYHKAGAF